MKYEPVLANRYKIAPVTTPNYARDIYDALEKQCEMELRMDDIEKRITNIEEIIGLNRKE